VSGRANTKAETSMLFACWILYSGFFLHAPCPMRHASANLQPKISNHLIPTLKIGIICYNNYH
jgi:hypothetical protein